MFTQAIFAAIFLLLMHAIKWIDLRMYNTPFTRHKNIRIAIRIGADPDRDPDNFYRVNDRSGSRSRGELRSGSRSNPDRDLPCEQLQDRNPVTRATFKPV